MPDIAVLVPRLTGPAAAHHHGYGNRRIHSLKARGRMQLAATAGATAFQKGLGMIHSLAHPLSALHHTHHGLANALLLPDSIEFIENSILNNA